MITYDFFVKAALERITWGSTKHGVANLIFGDSVGMWPPFPPTFYSTLANMAEAFGDAYKYAAFPAAPPTEVLRVLYGQDEMTRSILEKGWGQNSWDLPAPNSTGSEQVRAQYYNRAASLYALAVGLQAPEDRQNYPDRHVFALVSGGILNLFKVVVSASKLDFNGIGKYAMAGSALQNLTEASDRTKELAGKAKATFWLADQLAQKLARAPIDAQNAALALHTAQVAATKAGTLQVGGLIMGAIALYLVVDLLTD
jgi:hypothetical protein